MTLKKLAIAAAAALSFVGSAHAVTASDTVDLSSFGWGYGTVDFQHASIWGVVPAQATLAITAKDVDSTDGELDNVFAYNVDSSSWINLGNLTGTNNANSTTTFTFSLTPDWSNSISSGLKVSIQRDQTFVFGPVQSTLTAVVPEPETYAMLLAGLGAVGFMARRRQGK